MDIACPNCAATYRVPDHLLANGKALRCAACAHEWVPEVPVAPSEPSATAEVTLDGVPPPDHLPVFEPLDAEPDVAPALSTMALPRPMLPTEPPPLQRRSAVAARPKEASGATRRVASRMLPLAWMASVTLVVLTLFTLVMFGRDIAAAWPPFARVSLLISG